MLLILLMGLCAFDVDGQSAFNLGVKAETSLSGYVVSNIADAKSVMGFGAGVGGFIRFDFNEYVGIQPEVLCYWRNSVIERYGIAHDCDYLGFEIPVYAVGQIRSAAGGRAYIGVGPYFGLGMRANDKTEGIDLYRKSSGGISLQRGDIGAGIMIGYEFGNGIQINAGYKYGLINALSVDRDVAFMGNQSVSLGIGYSF